MGWGVLPILVVMDWIADYLDGLSAEWSETIRPASSRVLMEYLNLLMVPFSRKWEASKSYIPLCALPIPQRLQRVSLCVTCSWRLGCYDRVSWNLFECVELWIQSQT